VARGQGQGPDVQGQGLVIGHRGQGQGLSSRTTALGCSKEWLILADICISK